MKLLLTALASSLVLAGCATGTAMDRHAMRYPSASDATSTPTPGQIDTMMNAMRQMHEKMMAARTPEERSKLMQEHMKLMHEGMGMMGQMRGGMGGMGGMGMGGGMSMGPDRMERRMDMMEMMMQMMMDREDAASPAAK